MDRVKHDFDVYVYIHAGDDMNINIHQQKHIFTFVYTHILFCQGRLTATHSEQRVRSEKYWQPKHLPITMAAMGAHSHYAAII